jgi:hypothetical protein
MPPSSFDRAAPRGHVDGWSGFDPSTKNVERKREKRERSFPPVRDPLRIWIKMRENWLSSCKGTGLAQNL